MTDLIYDMITLGVDMLISAVILTAVIILMRSSTMLSVYSSEQQAISDRMNYYKEYSMYDCTDDLMSPDVLSSAVYYKYDVDIAIDLKNGQIWTNYIQNSNTHEHTGSYYCSTTGISPMTYDDIVNAIGSTKKFKSVLIEDFGQASSSGYRGGLITGIRFTEI